MTRPPATNCSDGCRSAGVNGTGTPPSSIVTHVVSSSGGEAGAGGVCALAIAGAQQARKAATTRPVRRTRAYLRLPRSSPRALLHVTQRDRFSKRRHRIALRDELVRED